MLKSLAIFVSILSAIVAGVPAAYAQYDFGGVADFVSGGVGVGVTDFGGVIALVMAALTPLVYAVAILVIIRAALLLIIEQSQNELSQFKNAIVGSLVAVVIVSIANPLAVALFGGGTVPSSGAAMGVSTELLGIVDFIEEPLVVLAIIMIIVSGIRTVLAWGGSDGLVHLRKTIVSILIGLILIIAKVAIATAVIDVKEPTPIIEAIVSLITVFLGFVTLAAVAVLIYAGFLMIVNIGKDDQYQRAKSLIIRVAIGIIVILVSVALAQVLLI